MYNAADWINARARFERGAAARYVPHLDMARATARTLARAGIKVWFTEGFNPHPYLIFAPPLPIGYCGANEAADMRLPADCDLGDALRRIAEASPPGFCFKSLYRAATGLGEISAALYSLQINFASQAERALEALAGGTLPVMKKSKRGEAAADALDGVRIVSAEARGGILTLEAVLPSEMGGRYTSPELIVAGLETACGRSADWVDGVRLEFYTKSGDLFV